MTTINTPTELASLSWRQLLDLLIREQSIRCMLTGCLAVIAGQSDCLADKYIAQKTLDDVRKLTEARS